MSIAMLVLTSAGSAQSLPKAINYVPNNAPVVFAIPSIENFDNNVRTFIGRFGALAEQMDLGPLDMMMDAQGVDTSGALIAAMTELPSGNESEEEKTQNFFVLVPVSDYETFAKGVGASASGIGEFEIEEGNPAYMKSLGSGYALLAPSEEIVTNFNASKDSAKFFTTLIGTSGMSVADTSDAFIIANLEMMRPLLEKGVENMGDQMGAQMAMVPNADQIAGMYTMIASAIARDGKSSVIGFDANDAGLLTRATVGFTPGSQSAKYMTAGSNASSLISHLPDMPYIFAFANDVSAPGISKMWSDYGTMAEQLAGDMDRAQAVEPYKPIMDAMKASDGSAFILGTNPIVTAGMFVNSVAFLKTSDPNGFRKAFGGAVSQLDTIDTDGVSLQSAFAQGAKDVNGTLVDTWKIQPKFDTNSEFGAQAPMMMMGLFGPAGGPSGLIGSAKTGVVMTMSNNSRLMQQGLDAANTGGSFGSDDLTRKVGSVLPSNRFFEGYFSIRDTWEMAEAAAGMMGGLPFDFEMPENTPPIGFGVGAGDDTMAMGLFIPNQLFDLIMSAQQQMGMGGGFGDDMEEDDGGRF